MTNQLPLSCEASKQEVAVEVAIKGLRRRRRRTWEAIARLAAAKAVSLNAPVVFYWTYKRINLN